MYQVIRVVWINDLQISVSYENENGIPYHYPFATGLIVILNAIWRVIALPCNTALHNYYNHYITIPLYLPYGE